MINLVSIIKKLWRNNRNSEAKCFSEGQDYKSPFDYIDRGLSSVPLNQIVGSVGKCHDFDSQFKPKNQALLDRLSSVKQAMWERKSLPPVQLYKIKDEYYVLDGNHRISAAQELGRSYITAKIVEIIPSNKHDNYHINITPYPQA
ncbi:MAG: ParB N-terminal domain-containing protein [Desulfobacterales bacterium]|nr:MAG: ParB N-terminal domain-containing protein [Desulfobacterales bacterium]